jgi:head-tail adaptor
MIDNYLNQDIEILALTASTGAVWGSSGAWAVSSTIKGLMRYTGGQERTVSDKETVLTTHRLYVKATTTLNERNRVQYAGRVYEVKVVATPTKAEFMQVDIAYMPDIAETT